MTVIEFLGYFLSMLPEVLEEVVSKLKMFPGLGVRSSRKLALDFLQLEKDEYTDLAESIQKMRDEVCFCSKCGFFATKSKTESADNVLCSICSDPKRDDRKICVVEKPTDVLLIEKSQNYNGHYFVLGNLISPLDNVFAENTNIAELFEKRLPPYTNKNQTIELILFFKAGFSSEATTAYIKERISKMSNIHIQLSKLAQGLPLYYNPDTLDQATMSLAISERKSVEL